MGSPKMNTSGPNGGKGAASAAGVRGTTVRPRNHIAEAGKNRGDTGLYSSQNQGGQRTMASQARQNRGSHQAKSVTQQRVGSTKVAAPTSHNRNSGQPRASQSSMRGTGSKRE